MRKKESITKIFAASLQVFAEYGYKKATVEDIASRLDMTKGNLYLYAKNKKDLYQQTVSHALLKWQAMVARRVEKENDPKKKFLVMCFKAVEYLSRDNDLRRVLVRDPDIFPMFPTVDPFYDINQASKEMIKGILEQGMKENVFRKLDVDRVSDVIFSIYKMFIIRAYIKNEDQAIQQMFADAVELMTNGLFIGPDL
ncbi:TetR/AcrR family transcriptional regulator [bacterium]|nr:TetR/AcrR family transcriptional regulator [bacterium]